MRSYTFDRFQLDLVRAVLLCEGDPVALRPKSFDVLRYLVQRPGRLVSRSELFDSVWPNLVVTDDSLTQCLTEIRKALGDESKEIIKTVPRRGYVFEARVFAEGVPGLGPTSPTGPSRRFKFGRLPSGWAMATLAVLAITVAASWWRPASGPAELVGAAEPRQAPASTIAVLPFVDMSEAGDQQYLGDGIAEEILNLLARSPGLTVIARTSSFAFHDANVDIGTMARRLNVSHVLEGSVRKAGDRVRVTAQLVDGTSEAQLWSETYEHRLVDIFALQDKIARAVAGVLQVELSAGGGGRDAPALAAADPHAWESYQRGRLFYSRRAEGDVIRAQRLFEQALDADPGFAHAWVALAATIHLRGSDPNVSADARLTADVALPLVREALEKALALDPLQPEALWRLSRFNLEEGQPELAIDRMNLAMQRGANIALVQAMMAGFASQAGLPELAVPFQARAAILDPVSAVHQVNLGEQLYRARRFDEAQAAFRRAAELNPDWLRVQHANQTWMLIHRGEFEAAARTAREIPVGADRDQAEAMLAHLRGDHAAADTAIARLLARPVEEAASRLAFVHAMRGETDAAFRWLSTAVDLMAERGCGAARQELTVLRASPFVDSLRGDSRWQAWLSDAQQRFYLETDSRIIAMLEEYLERQPELYSGALSVTGPPSLAGP